MRLIDADALEKELKKDIMGGLNYRWYINNAPTVDVLDKISAEIADNHDYYFFAESNKDIALGLEFALDIIDKYK